MNKKNFWKDTIIVGLALFSTMFGAGNLIFPPQIGLFSGDQWMWGALGLLLGGIVLPVLALWAVNNVGDKSQDLMGHVSPWFYNAYYLIGCSFIAMGSTLPRSAATTHEMAIQPLFPNVPIWITVIVFFVLVYFFACDPNSVIDKLGKYMTPILVVLLAIVLIKGVISPLGTPVDTGIGGGAFGDAILTAYNTGDLTVGIMFASVILLDLRRRGYNGQESKKGGFMAGIICIVVLFAVYGTLTYIGACASGVYPQDTAQTALLSGIIQDIMGPVGMACLGGAVAHRCVHGHHRRAEHRQLRHPHFPGGLPGPDREYRAGPAQQIPAQRRLLQGRRAHGRGGEPGRRGAQRQPQHRLAPELHGSVPLLRPGLCLGGSQHHRHGRGRHHLPRQAQVPAPARPC